MSDAENPYKTPAVSGESTPEQAATGSITAKTIEYLGAASPWAQFLGIMGFIGSGLVMLSGLVVAITGPLAANLGNPGMAAFGAIGPWLGIAYIILGVIYIFPSRYVYTIGSTMKKMKSEPSPEQLEKLAKNLKSAFLFAGVLTIIIIALAIVVFIVSIAVGMNAALNAYR